MSSNTNSRKLLLGFAIVFILPVVLAKLALDNDWFNRGSTNRGQLITPVLDVSGIVADGEKRWRVMYVVPSACGEECENAVYAIQQVVLALGKESDRASASLVLTPDSDQAKFTSLETGRAELLNTSVQSVNSVFDTELGDGIFLVDTLNNAMMHYPLHASREDAVMQSRDILYDLKKMLKLSRIG